MSELSHFDEAGAAHMVDVSAKDETERVAVASCRVLMQPATAALIAAGEVGKGDVLGIARIAGIQGLKRTAELIPLCHPLRITGVDLALTVVTASAAGEPAEDAPGDKPAHVAIVATVRARDRTGVEMEALTAVSVAALTVYDMCKAVDRGMIITDVRLDAKRGGKSGMWARSKDPHRSDSR